MFTGKRKPYPDNDLRYALAHIALEKQTERYYRLIIYKPLAKLFWKMTGYVLRLLLFSITYTVYKRHIKDCRL